MNHSLHQYCNLIADQCVTESQSLHNHLKNSLKNHGHNLKTTDEKEIALTLAFLNLFVAQGTWSNLKNSTLRRDLLNETKDAMIFKLASIFKNGQSNEKIAAETVKIDFDKFRPYAKFHAAQLKGFNKESVDANSNLYISLMWLQEKLNLSDSLMENIVLSFIEKTNRSFDKIEGTALTISNSENKKKNKGFWGRIFRS